MVAVVGTMAADLVHSKLSVSLAVSTLGGLALAGTFWAWHRTEGNLSIHSITTRRRAVFYWLAVSFTFALGTAAGDLTADQLGFGYLGSITLFVAVMTAPALGRWRFHIDGVVAFWFAYVVTRPLGASIADWLGKPVSRGGLGFGDGPVAATLLVTTAVLVTYLARTRADTPVRRTVEAELTSAELQV